MCKVRAYATSANLGVMFDCGGIAINELYTDISFDQAKEGQKIMVKGYGSETIPTDYSNLAIMSVSAYLSYTGKTLPGYLLEMDNHIPFSGGLGSSAASIIGALKACNAYFNNLLSNHELLKIALTIEPHGDNLAACLFGGFTLFTSEIIVKNTVSDKLCAVLIIPPYTVSTKEARSVLPKSYCKNDTIKALQQSALLTHGIINGDLFAIKKVLEQDLIHEPYRFSLNKKIKEVRDYASMHDSLGTVISGSGATIISFTEAKKQEALFDALRSHFNEMTIIKVSFNNNGATIL